MSNDKGLGENGSLEAEENREETPSAASRARNRTVMLTPEMTGQVRALLKGEPGEAETERPFGGGDWEQAATPKSADRADNGELEAVTTGDSVFDPMTSIVPPVAPEVPRHEPSAGAVLFSAEAQVQQTSYQAPQVSQVPQFSGTAAPVQWLCGESKIVGFLISYDKDDNGEVFPVRAGRWLVSSRPTDHGEYLLIDDETVSPLHAILRATPNGALQVLDQLSEHGTGVYRAGQEDEIEVSGGLESLGHGDTVRFGDRYFLVCLIPEVVSAEE